MKILSPYLVLDLGAGLTPLTQKLASACNLLFVVAEPVANSLAYVKMLIDSLVEMGISKKAIQVVAVNRVRSDTQLTMSQLEEQVGQPPVVAITPMPELLYTAARLKTTVVTSRPDSLSTQQFAKLAESVLEYEKRNVKNR